MEWEIWQRMCSGNRLHCHKRIAARSNGVELYKPHTVNLLDNADIDYKSDLMLPDTQSSVPLLGTVCCYNQCFLNNIDLINP